MIIPLGGKEGISRIEELMGDILPRYMAKKSFLVKISL
jgi:hypothetical protein